MAAFRVSKNKGPSVSKQDCLQTLQNCLKYSKNTSNLNDRMTRKHPSVTNALSYSKAATSSPIDFKQTTQPTDIKIFFHKVPANSQRRRKLQIPFYSSL